MAQGEQHPDDRAARADSVGSGLLGRVIGPWGSRSTDTARWEQRPRWACSASSRPAMSRQPIRAPLATGVRVLDGVLTCGKGQRVGIFAGSGVGKSTLLGMIARSTADVNVIGLVGERRARCRVYRARSGPEGLERSVVVVATSDNPRCFAAGALLATGVAEYFRDKGRKDVLLVMDSSTRLAMAQREIGLAAGEPRPPKGTRPRCSPCSRGCSSEYRHVRRGSITGTVYRPGGGRRSDEPIADAVARHPGRPHRALADAGERTISAVDVLASPSAASCRTSPRQAIMPRRRSSGRRSVRRGRSRTWSGSGRTLPVAIHRPTGP